jgi:GlpG protein
MRAIGTVANEQDAQRLGAFLLTLGIASQMDPAHDGYQVWIREEDKVERAKQELARFLQNPADPRYQTAEQLAQQVRQQQTQAEKQYQRNVRDIRSQWGRPSPKSCPLTLGLIAACLVVAALSSVGREKEGILNYLYITHVKFRDDGQIEWHRGLPEVRRGQVWRLVTPIFIHFKELHLFFNMWWLYNLGGVIEIQRGKWRLALLVIASAVISNLAQFLFKHPAFGGMSGVVYALLGYAWMKSRFDPAAGMYIATDTVTMMIVWLFLCMIPGFPINVANHAHVAGMIVGVVVGYAPTLWRKMSRR